MLLLVLVDRLAYMLEILPIFLCKPDGSVVCVDVLVVDYMPFGCQ